MNLILDAGALVALERGDRDVWRRVRKAKASGLPPITHGGVIAQVWRGGSGRQARLAIALAGIEVHGLDDELGRATGVLLGRAGTSDAIDAALVVIAFDDDRVITSDAMDIKHLAAVAGKHLDVIPV